MSNEIATKPGSALSAGAQSGRMAVADIIAHVALVQEVMRAVMKPDVHFGVIPVTEKHTLLTQDAEVRCMAFRVADSYQVEDLSTADTVRYRVTCLGTHQTSGVVLGSGMGEASSGEEKYKWRKAFDDEFNATPENLRRIKKGKYTTKQIRTEPADLANTILKMANKRAKIAMTINVTACGDMFGQDLEDMDEALRDHLTRHGQEAPPVDDTPKPAARQALPEWRAESVKAQAVRWSKAVVEGFKSVEDILTLARSKGTLTADQEAHIKTFKTVDAASDVTDVQTKEAPAPQPEPAGVDDDDGLPWKD